MSTRAAIVSEAEHLAMTTMPNHAESAFAFRSLIYQAAACKVCNVTPLTSASLWDGGRERACHFSRALRKAR